MSSLNPIFRATIDVTDGPLVPKLSKRRFQAAMFNALWAMAEAHQKTLPGHADTGAATKYGYARRSPRYVERQRKAFPGWRPDYRTGQLRKTLVAAKGTRPSMIQGSSSGVYLIKAKLGSDTMQNVTDRFRYKKGQTSLTQQQEQLVMRKAEITATTAAERHEIGKAAAEGFIKYIASGNRTRVRVK